MSGIQRVTSDQPFTMSVLLTAQDSEAPIDPDGSPASCTFSLVHVNGKVIVAPTAATRLAMGAFSYLVPTQPPLNAVATWSYTMAGAASTATRYVSVIASHYVDLSEIRAMDGVSSASDYPTALLADRRSDAEVLFEIVTGQFWSPHYVMDVLDGDPNYRRALQSAVPDIIDYIPMKRLVLTERQPRVLLGMRLDETEVDSFAPVGTFDTVTGAGGTAFTCAALIGRVAGADGGKRITAKTGMQATQAHIAGNDAAGNYTTSAWGDGAPAPADPFVIASPLTEDYSVYESGEVQAGFGVAAFPRGLDNVIIEYLAGHDTMPSDLRLALLQYCRFLVLNSNARIPDRATSMTTEFGTFRIGQASPWLNPTGISSVDSVLQRYGERLPAFS